MKLAFCLFKYFPYGGLQRDFLRILRVCTARGHEAHVFTMQWKSEPEPGLTLHLIQTKGIQNHTQCAEFARKVSEEIKKGRYDLVIGFNKLPQLDMYYAADVCYQARIRTKYRFFYRFLPRYRKWLALEKAVFEKGMKTEIMLISPLQRDVFMQYYQTEPERLHLLPPGIAKDRMAPLHAAQIRLHMRKIYEIKPDDFLILMIGSGFKTKGLDRSIKALASLPSALRARCRLFIIGQDNPAPFLHLAKKLKINDKIHFLHGRSDVLEFLLAADLLLHPAYHENTGTVLLEAMAAGLPVLTSANCGYAHYIEKANAGFVLPLPFQQWRLNDALQTMITSPNQLDMRQNALLFTRQNDIYSMPEKAADLIELIGHRRGPLSR